MKCVDTVEIMNEAACVGVHKMSACIHYELT